MHNEIINCMFSVEGNDYGYRHGHGEVAKEGIKGGFRPTGSGAGAERMLPSEDDHIIHNRAILLRHALKPNLGRNAQADVHHTIPSPRDLLPCVSGIVDGFSERPHSWQIDILQDGDLEHGIQVDRAIRVTRRVELHGIPFPKGRVKRQGGGERALRPVESGGRVVEMNCICAPQR